MRRLTEAVRVYRAEKAASLKRKRATERRVLAAAKREFEAHYAKWRDARSAGKARKVS